jgi:hypothetical protein
MLANAIARERGNGIGPSMLTGGGSAAAGSGIC